MKARDTWHFLLPPAAIVLPIAAFFSLRTLWAAAYDGAGAVSDTAELPLTFLIMGVGGILAGGLAVAGIYLLLVRSRLWIAIPLIVVLCLPALLCASACCLILLSFLVLI